MNLSESTFKLIRLESIHKPGINDLRGEFSKDRSGGGILFMTFYTGSKN